MSEKMETQKAMEIMSKFFNLLDKQEKKDEDVKPALYKAGERVILEVEQTTKDGKIVLGEKSQLVLAATILNVSEETLVGKYITAMSDSDNEWLFQRRISANDQLKCFSEEVMLFIQRRKVMQVDLEKFLASIQPLTDPEFVDALLELIREVDPLKADEVELAMRGELQSKDDEIAELRRQLAEMKKQRDEAVDIAKEAMRQTHDDNPTPPEPAAEAKVDDKQTANPQGNGKSGKKGRQEVNHNHGGQNGDSILNMVADGQPQDKQDKKDAA